MKIEIETEYEEQLEKFQQKASQEAQRSKLPFDGLSYFVTHIVAGCLTTVCVFAAIQTIESQIHEEN